MTTPPGGGSQGQANEGGYVPAGGAPDQGQQQVHPPQQGYVPQNYAPPGYGAEGTAAPPSKSKRTPLIVGIVVVVALVIGGGLWFTLARGGGDTSSPKAVTKALYDAAKAGNDDKAKTFVCSAKKASFGIGLIAEKETYKIFETKKEGDTNTVRTEVDDFNLRMAIDVIVKKENGNFCVTSLMIDWNRSKSPGTP